MKSFFKFLLASVLGILIGFFLFFLISAAIIGALVASADRVVEVQSNTIFHMKLDRPIVDRATSNPFEDFDFFSMRPVKQFGLNDILENIEKAKNDNNIDGIFLEVSIPRAGISTLGEIRAALLDFKESGKFVVASSDTYAQTAYYLASVADDVYLTPTGYVQWTGLRSEVMFFKGTLEKLGLEPEILRHGEYKSAVEPFMQEGMSRESREQVMTYLNSIWQVMLYDVAASRDISIDHLDRISDGLLVRSDKTALEQGLVDDLIYRDDVIRILKELTGVDPDDDLKTVDITRYTRVAAEREGRRRPREKLAIVYAEGTINVGEGGPQAIGSDRISRALREARRDTTIKAIVFRVNSPGGSALASEVIWREVELASKEKPVIVSMGDVAASGGYYIAAPATRIVASPQTITGSIGVFGILLDASGFFNDKIGITVDVVKTNQFADIGSIFRPLTPAEREILQSGVEDIYMTFTKRVADGRDMEPGRVDEIGQGRVWSGADAKDIGLVDEFGGLRRAIEIAAEEAGLDTYRTISLPRIPDPFEELLKAFSFDARLRLFGQGLGDTSSRYFESLRFILENHGIQARMPFDIQVY
jgi:protease IV